MYLRDTPVLAQQFLVDEVDMSYLHHLVLEAGVVLDIYTVWHGHVGDGRRLVDILGSCLDQYLSPVHFFSFRL